MLRGGGLLTYGNLLPTAQGFGPPMHAARLPAMTVQSFGALPAPAASAGGFPRAVLAAARPPGDVWLAWQRRYEVELWDASGRQHLVLVRGLDWFAPWDGTGTASGHPGGFGPTIRSLHEDSRGRLWVVIQRVLDFGPNPDNPLDRPAPTKFETVIEVLDPVAGRLVLSDRTAGGYTHVRDDLVARYKETPEGVAYIELFRLAVIDR
jgi:hypothetical protein